MKRSYKWKFSVALFALLIVELIKRIPAWSAFYGETVYPTVFRILNRFSSRFTFSLYDLLILILIGSLIWIIVDFIRKKKPIEILYRLILFGIWIYVVFYLFWGINYFKPDFYRRTRIEPETYDSLRFDRFVNRYIDTLNANQVHFRDVLSDSIINREIQTGYSRIRDPYRLSEPPEYYRSKEMHFGGLYA